MGFIPYFYTEIAGLYTLKPGNRIKIWAAGCYANVCLGYVGLIVYRVAVSHLSPVVGQILLKIALSNFFMILGNLSPLMPTDGYFILSTLLKQVNVRTNAFQEFVKWVSGKANRFGGITLVYFLATAVIITSGFIIQAKWFIGMFRELYHGTPGQQTLHSGLLLLMIGLTLVLRVVLSLVAKGRARKAPPPSRIRSIEA